MIAFAIHYGLLIFAAWIVCKFIAGWFTRHG